MQLSSIVAARLPCTVPAGLRWMSFGSEVTVCEPLDKLKAAHLLLFVGAVCPIGLVLQLGIGFISDHHPKGRSVHDRQRDGAKLFLGR